MERIPPFKEFLTESEELNEAKYKGKKIYPNWLTKHEVGSPVTRITELTPGEKYVIYDAGMDVWNGEYEYVGFMGSFYTWEDASPHSGSGQYQLTQGEVFDSIKNKEIREQL
jgi:hypothetical protein